MTTTLPKSGSPRTEWVREIADKTLDSFPELAEREQRLSLAIHGLLLRGEPVSVEDLASTTGIAPDAAKIRSRAILSGSQYPPTEWRILNGRRS